MDDPYRINRRNMHDLFVLTAGYQDIEIKKDPGCFSVDVCHSHDRIVPVAGLRVYPHGSSLDFGKCYQLNAVSVCVTSQDKAWIKKTVHRTEPPEVFFRLAPSTGKE